MGGKSSYVKTVALLTVMTQIDVIYLVKMLPWGYLIRYL